MATVVLAAPSYVPDANAALAVQALQFAALLQGQVGLGVAILAVSVAMWHVPGWRAVAIIGLVAGAIDLARPLAVALPVLAIALFIPTFVWIALSRRHGRVAAVRILGHRVRGTRARRSGRRGHVPSDLLRPPDRPTRHLRGRTPGRGLPTDR